MLIAAGTYSGIGNCDLRVGDKSIVFEAVSGPDSTIIDCQYLERAFLLNRGALRVEIIGLTILRGYDDDEGGGIYCQGATLVLRDCVVTECFAEFGAAMWLSDCSVSIESCLISDNEAYSPMGDIGDILRCEMSKAIIRDTSIRGNRSLSGWGLCVHGGVAMMERCGIVDNSTVHGAVMLDSGRFRMNQCLIANNRGSYAAAIWINTSDIAAILESCTIVGNEASWWGAIFLPGCRNLVLEKTILRDNCGGSYPDMTYLSSGGAVLRNCAVDTTGINPDLELRFEGVTIFEDPEFCEPVRCGLGGSTSYYLQSSSRCRPENNAAGVLIGYTDAPCSSIAGRP